MSSRNFQFFGGIVSRVNTKEKVVALTFDDGPSKKVDKILSILNEENVKATFFLIGSEIDKYPDEAKKLVLSGQEIGNHTYSHNRMVFKSPSYIKKEIEDTDRLIRKIGYKDAIQFRPPNGKKLILLPYYLEQNNRKTILWDLEPNSYPEINSDSNKIVKYVIDNARPGSIILLHPMYDEKDITINSIKGIIEGLKKKGYTFKTVNQLLEMEKK
ncbi:polysaccharide deacetylase family protein [Clostridium sp. OS1-26]|uniref:polysaccharide deacetylase family protein n=1 Tax=Clostridium sp. OS1-26 TaxID=3070681 RepID=UPI0027E1A88A|nr:polysaccharide deacetylase family protein [Clostridium sp. OS1-26]WML33004.1 polysaccharide deacetylase family protein [Clostridium sp. OS1-26]